MAAAGHLQMSGEETVKLCACAASRGSVERWDVKWDLMVKEEGVSFKDCRTKHTSRLLPSSREDLVTL